MTSAPSAEPNTSTPGPFDCTTVGREIPTDTEPTDTGALGLLPDLGSLERSLIQLLSQRGIPEESTADIAQGTTLLVRLWFLDWLGSSTLGTLPPPTESEKPPSTLILGS